MLIAFAFVGCDAGQAGPPAGADAGNVSPVAVPDAAVARQPQEATRDDLAPDEPLKREYASSRVVAEPKGKWELSIEYPDQEIKQFRIAGGALPLRSPHWRCVTSPVMTYGTTSDVEHVELYCAYGKGASAAVSTVLLWKRPMPITTETTTLHEGEAGARQATNITLTCKAN